MCGMENSQDYTCVETSSYVLVIECHQYWSWGNIIFPYIVVLNSILVLVELTLYPFCIAGHNC